MSNPPWDWSDFFKEEETQEIDPQEMQRYREEMRRNLQGCNHQWKEYIGFNVDKYMYCTVCNEKKKD